MITVDKIFVKYANSSEKWILPLPIVENGQLKLKCFMTDRKALTGTFTRFYTYLVDFQTLYDFFSYKSHGQAYNELIKYKKVRTGFLEESDKEEGLFFMSDVIQNANDGRTKFVLENITKAMNIKGRVFTMEAITELEKAKRKQEAKELKELEKELLDMGYDY